MFGAAIATAAVRPLEAVIVADDLYINQKLGVAFRKPSPWGYESLRRFADLRNTYEIGVYDPLLEQELKSGELPIVVVSQFGALNRLGASLGVYVENVPLLPGESLLAFFPGIVSYLQRMFAQFEVIRSPVQTEISGYESIEYLASFIYNDSRTHNIPARQRGVITTRGPMLYTFNMMDMPAKQLDTQREFNQLIGSIKYV
jgi:hypothetical protein